MCERSAATYGRRRQTEFSGYDGVRDAARTYTDGVDDIVQGQLGDQGVELEKQGQRLSDTTC